MSDRPIIRHCKNCEWCKCNGRWSGYNCQVRYKTLDENEMRLTALFCRHYRRETPKLAALDPAVSARITHDRGLTYGDIYRQYKAMFPDTARNTIDYRPAETPYSIRVWQKDNRVLVFTYDGDTWLLETDEHYKIRNDLPSEEGGNE